MKLQLDYYLSGSSIKEAEHIAYYLEAEGFDTYLPHRDMPEELRYLFSALMNEAKGRDVVVVIWDDFSVSTYQSNLTYVSQAIQRFREIGLHKIVFLNVSNQTMPFDFSEFREYEGISGFAEYLRSLKIKTPKTSKPRQSNFFLSYSSENADCAHQLANMISQFGSVWFAPTNMVGVFDFMEEIYTAIESSSNFVQLVTSESVCSPYCKRELAVAVDNDKPIFPLSEIEMSEIPKYLKFAVAGRHINRVNCRDLDSTLIQSLFKS